MVRLNGSASLGLTKQAGTVLHLEDTKFAQYAIEIANVPENFCSDEIYPLTAWVPQYKVGERILHCSNGRQVNPGEEAMLASSTANSIVTDFEAVDKSVQGNTSLL